VKATIYHTLLRYTAILENHLSQPFPQKPHSLSIAVTPNFVMDMKELLQLFDDILTEEYSPDHLMIRCLSPPSHTTSPSPSNASSVTLIHDFKDSDDVPKDSDGCITCDFCGGDIFQSFFECYHCVERKTLGKSEVDERGESFMICAGCYVEGRSCKCGKMDAVQCQPFDNLEQLRCKAFCALNKFTQDNGFLLALDEKPLVFLYWIVSCC
jgi:hypothetical protein